MLLDTADSLGGGVGRGFGLERRQLRVFLLERGGVGRDFGLERRQLRILLLERRAAVSYSYSIELRP